MRRNDLILLFEKNNPWWTAEFRAEYKPRIIYSEIQKLMHLRHIITLSGLRRSGKTTIMKKIIEDNLLKYRKENIFYFSFDENKDVRIMHILDEYAKYANQKLDKGKFLILLDEVQKVENWNEQLKTIYDIYPNIKIILSGSESLFIRKRIRESLAGRMFEFSISPLRFSEYLDFRGKKFDNLQLYRNQIIEEFGQFLICGGFPEIISESKEICEKYVRENVIDKIIFKDIPQLVPMSDPPLLESIFKVILNDPGQIINLNELAGELGASRQTISLYISYLEKSFLIRKLYNYSKNVRKTQRRYKRYYPTITPHLLIGDINSFGKVFETAMVNELSAEFFWRDSFKNEVDIIRLEPLMAIEVKSGDVRERDLHSLRHFINKFSPKESFVISYEEEKVVSGINVVPFYKYLLSNTKT